jgi:hypothetical protein
LPHIFTAIDSSEAISLQRSSYFAKQEGLFKLIDFLAAGIDPTLVASSELKRKRRSQFGRSSICCTRHGGAQYLQVVALPAGERIKVATRDINLSSMSRRFANS